MNRFIFALAILLISHCPSAFAGGGDSISGGGGRTSYTPNNFQESPYKIQFLGKNQGEFVFEATDEHGIRETFSLRSEELDEITLKAIIDSQLTIIRNESI